MRKTQRAEKERVLELKWLEDFIAVAEKGHFARASAERFITQSALSRRIQSLESWLGAELLDRSHHPITLTLAGETFMPTARHLIAQAREARAATSELGRLSDQSVTIASLHTLTLSYIPELVSDLQLAAGQFSASIIAETRTVDEYLVGLSNGSSDFFVCYDHPSVPMGLDLSEFPRLTLSSHQLNLYQSSSLPTPDLSSSSGPPIPFLEYAPRTYMSRVIEPYLMKAPFRKRLNTVYRASLAEGLFTAAKRGLGLAFLPETVAPGTAEDYGLEKIAESLLPTLSICIYRSSKNKNPVAERIWAALEVR